jgi:hypothetical protein
MREGQGVRASGARQRADQASGRQLADLANDEVCC